MIRSYNLTERLHVTCSFCPKWALVILQVRAHQGADCCIFLERRSDVIDGLPVYIYIYPRLVYSRPLIVNKLMDNVLVKSDYGLLCFEESVKLYFLHCGLTSITICYYHLILCVLINKCICFSHFVQLFNFKFNMLINFSKFVVLISLKIPFIPEISLEAQWRKMEPSSEHPLRCDEWGSFAELAVRLRGFKYLLSHH